MNNGYISMHRKQLSNEQIETGTKEQRGTENTHTQRERERERERGGERKRMISRSRQCVPVMIPDCHFTIQGPYSVINTNINRLQYSLSRKIKYPFPMSQFVKWMKKQPYSNYNNFHLIDLGQKYISLINTEPCLPRWRVEWMLGALAKLPNNCIIAN